MCSTYHWTHNTFDGIIITHTSFQSSSLVVLPKLKLQMKISWNVLLYFKMFSTLPPCTSIIHVLSHSTWPLNICCSHKQWLADYSFEWECLTPAWLLTWFWIQCPNSTHSMYPHNSNSSLKTKHLFSERSPLILNSDLLVLLPYDQ